LLIFFMLRPPQWLFFLTLRTDLRSSQPEMVSLPGLFSLMRGLCPGLGIGSDASTVCYTLRVGGELCAFLLLAAAGLFQAAFALPIKYTREWRWEQVWAAQSATANVLFPLVWAMSVPRELWDQAGRIPVSHWITSYGWGLLWGGGGVAYSLALTRLGMAFANSLVIGVSIIVGALLPLATKAADTSVRPASFTMGLVLCILSTALLGLFRRGANQKTLLAMPLRLDSYGRVVVVAVVSGVLSASYGLALAFKFDTVRALTGGRISALSASLLVLLPVYLGGASVAIPIALSCSVRSRTLSLFWRANAVRNWLLALVMGFCAAATAVFYNLGSTMGGHPSPNVSFAVFMAFFLVGGVVLGFLTGEMRESARAAKIGLLLSAGGLVVAAVLLNVR
jgi:L-rhamnose-H+ transport protein